MSRTRQVVLASLALLLDTHPSSGQVPDKPKVSYWPTPQKVVEKMLDLAKVTKDDVVYDLGCGDGRIVVTAGKKYGAKAVGVDIDPARVREALARVKAAKVEGLVTIRKEDMFKTDLTGATVVTLYLNDKANLALMPILKKSLKPGARVVSQTWDMGDWKPDKTITVTGIDEKEGTRHDYKLYLWIIAKPDDKHPSEPAPLGEHLRRCPRKRQTKAHELKSIEFPEASDRSFTISPHQEKPMQKIICVMLTVFFVAFGSTTRSAQEKEITFDEVHKNPSAFKGKKIAWEGKFSGLLNNRVTFIGNYDRKGAGQTEPWQLFVVDFPDGKDALAAVGGGKVTGTVEGEVTISAQVYKGKKAEKVKAPLIKLLSFEKNKAK